MRPLCLIRSNHDETLSRNRFLILFTKDVIYDIIITGEVEEVWDTY